MIEPCPACEFDQSRTDRFHYSICGRCGTKWMPKLIEDEQLKKPLPKRKALVVEKNHTGRKIEVKPRGHAKPEDVMILKKQGLQWLDIAQRLGVAKSTVGRIIMREYRKAGIPVSGRGRKKD